MSSDAEMLRSRTVSISIAVPPDRVIAYISDPANLPEWSFFASVTETPSGWVATTPGGGSVGIRFDVSETHGVVDHFVAPPGRDEIHVPMRVVPNGPGSEVLFTLFQMPAMSDEDFARDAAVVEEDLASLRAILEAAD